MKYGDTLQQRSIPEWQAYNVDYNEIKKLIKLRTSAPTASAIAIPGQRAKSAETNFEDELLQVLQEQHDTVNMFVRSKAGEIKRRLEHMHKIVVQMRRRTDGATKKKIPVKRLERYSRIENDALKVGEELQSLARFVAAQEQAFRKLLKKYKKWTGSSMLTERFNKEVLTKTQVFMQADIAPLLAQYEDVLETLRAPFKEGFTWGADATDNVSVQDASRRDGGKGKMARTKGNSAAELCRVCETGTNLEVDVDLATVPLGLEAGCASYWVHPENMVQLQVLLLQHLRLRTAKDRTSSSSEPPSPTSPRKLSVSGLSALSQPGVESDVDLMVFDDLEDFAKRRSGLTIRDLETRHGRRPEDANLGVRCGPSGDAIIYAPTFLTARPPKATQDSETLKAYVQKKKTIRPLLDTNSSASSSSNRGPNGAALGSKQDASGSCQKIVQWRAEHPHITPLVRILSTRSRFVGLSNTSEHGLWATLDRDITMLPCSMGDLETSDNNNNNKADAESFPYAVLWIRWEGQRCPTLVNVLDSSHLVERVPGFSLEVHAVATICKPSSMSTPFWSQALQKDIRKLPAKTPRSRKGSTTPTSTGTRPTSISAASILESSGGFSAAQKTSPPTSIPDPSEVPPTKSFKKKQSSRHRSSMNYQTFNRHDKAAPRYWNEFDDGEERPSEESYTILVDPNAQDPIVELWNRFKFSAIKTIDGAHILYNKARGQSAEQQPLLQERPQSHHNSADSEDSDDSPDSPTISQSHPRPKFRSRYSAFPSFHQARDPLDPLSFHQIQQRETLLIRCTVGAFIASFMLLLVAAMLEFTRRKRYVVSADVGTLVGIISSFLFAVAGVGLSSARHRDGDTMFKVQVGLAFALICLGNGIVVLLLVGS